MATLTRQADVNRFMQQWWTFHQKGGSLQNHLDGHMFRGIFSGEDPPPSEFTWVPRTKDENDDDEGVQDREEGSYIRYQMDLSWV